MSDRFDPDAWPYPEDNEPKGASSDKQTKDVNDEYESLDFNNGASSQNPAGYSDPYSDTPYSDTGFDDYGYGAPAAGQPGQAQQDDYGYGAPAASQPAQQDDYGYGAPSAAAAPADNYGYGAAPANDDYGFGPAAAPASDDYGYGDAPSSGYGTPAGSAAAYDEYTDPNTGSQDREPYGSADQGAGYADQYDTSQSSRSSGSYDEDDPYSRATSDEYDEYEDDDYADDDFEDDFGREPERQGGGARKLLLIGAIVFLVIAAVLAGLYVFRGGEDEGAQTPTPTTARAAEEGTDTTEGSATPTTDADGNQQLTVTPADQVPTAVTDTLNGALGAWGQYAVSGDLTPMQQYFATDGSQWTALQAESEALRANPPGGNPMSFTIADTSSAAAGSDVWIIRGTVSVAREGDPTQQFVWEFRLQNIDGKWLITTIRTP